MENKKFYNLLAVIGIAVMFLVSDLFAVPANPFPRQVKQANGSEVTIVMRGDEFFNWTESSDGYVVTFDINTKNWCYAYISDGKIQPSSVILGDSDKVTRGTPLNKITAKELQPLMNKVNKQKNPQKSPRSSVIPTNSSGVKNMNPSILVMLLEYNDASIVKGMDYWENRFFGNSFGQLNHYYNEISGGKFKYKGLTKNGDFIGTLPSGISSVDIYSNGVAKVRFTKNHPGYTNVNNGETNQIIVKEDMNTAFNAVKSYFDFEQFSSDLYKGEYIKSSDLSVYAVIAGWEFSAGLYPQNTDLRQIWAHAQPSQLERDATLLSVEYANLELKTFAVQGEIFEGDMNSSAKTMGVGVAAHELGHVLGLPDLYDYSGESLGIGPYSLMAFGSWGGVGTWYDYSADIRGHRPVHPDAWSKIKLGFVEPIEISVCESWKGNLNTFSSGSEYNVLKIINPAVDTEQYFLVENRGIDSYDKGMDMFGIKTSNNNDGGILIYHIDESVKDTEMGLAGWLDNSNYHRRAVNVEEADGSNLVVRYSEQYLGPDAYNFYNHFFSNTYYLRVGTPYVNFGGRNGTFNEFNASTMPNSDFYNSDDGTSFKPSNFSIKINSEKGSVMEVELVSSGHDFSLWEVTKAPSCGVEGEETEKCSICGMLGTRTRSVDAPEHDFSDWEITTPATCEAEGEETEKCSLCGELGEITRVIPKLTEGCETSIIPQKSDNRYGIKFIQNPVFDNAEINVILPENAKAVETKIVVYDNVGNIVARVSNGRPHTAGAGSKATTSPFVWNLQNQNGKFVANGTYLVIAEVKSQNGQNYYYSAKLGVKR